MAAVFYYGMHPNLQAASTKGVTTNNDKLTGQEVTWSLWREIKEGKAFHWAEVVFRAKPGTNRQDLSHMLMSARTNEQVEALRTALQEMKQNRLNEKFQAGCCWVMQWSVPWPRTRVRQSTGMISRPGKQPASTSTASASRRGWSKAGMSTALLITRKFA